MSNILLFRRRHPDPSTGVADDGIHYVRPAGGSYGAEDGSTYANAWNGFTNIAWGAGVGQVGPGDTLYWCGDFSDELMTVAASGTLGSPIIIAGDYISDPGTAERYEEALIGDWTEVDPNDPTSASPGSNFWIADTRLTQDNICAVVWFGSGWTQNVCTTYWETSTFTTVTPADVPGADYETATFSGGGGVNSHVGVYAVGNPVTYYTSLRWASNINERTIRVSNRSYITFRGGTLKRTGKAIDIVNNVNSTTNNDIVVTGVSFDQVSIGVNTVTSLANSRLIDGMEVTGCSFENCGAAGVVFDEGFLDGDIHNNSFINIGYSYSLGGVYLTTESATVAKPILVRNNTFSYCYSGYFWTADGAAVETDAGSVNTHIYQNTISNCWQAWHDNSGSENWFYLNRINDCALLSYHTDGGANNDAQPHIIANAAQSLTADASYNGASFDLACFLRANDLTYGASGIEVKNNILIGATGAENGLKRHDNVVAGGDWNEDYNCIWNVAEEIVDTSNNAEAQNNAQNVNPSLDANYRPTNALLVGAGIAVAGVTTDYAGNTYSDPPTIGAFEMEGIAWGGLTNIHLRRRRRRMRRAA